MAFTKRYASSERFGRYQHEQAYLLAKNRLNKYPIDGVREWEYTGFIRLRSWSIKAFFWPGEENTTLLKSSWLK